MKVLGESMKGSHEMRDENVIHILDIFTRGMKRKKKRQVNKEEHDLSCFRYFLV